MNVLVSLCILSIAFPVVAGAIYAMLHGSTPKRRAPLYEALRAFANERGAPVEEQHLLDKIQCEVSVSVDAVPCSVHLGWRGSDFRLRLSAQLAGLEVEAFEECWDRDWVRFLKRDYDQRLQVFSGSGRISLSGPAQSLRETFAEVDRADMARLFQAPPQGPCREHRRLIVQEGLLAVEVEFPGAEDLEDLGGRLAALVRLAKFSVRPFGEEAGPAPQGGGPQLVDAGKVMVSVQAGQRCAYCRESLVGGDAGPVKTCGACKSSLHAACLQEHGGCCTVGCRNNPRR